MQRGDSEAAWENNTCEGRAEIAVMHAKARQGFPAVTRGYERGPEEIVPGTRRDCPREPSEGAHPANARGRKRQGGSSPWMVEGPGPCPP